MVTVYLAANRSVFYDPAWLILLGNTLFLTGVSLLVSYVAARSYAATGHIQNLLLGCGVLIFGIGGMLAAVVRSLPDGANLNVTIYNTGALLGAAFHVVAAFILLGGVSPEVGSRRRRFWLLLGYACSLLLMALLTAACFRGLVPPFFVQGIGPTALRQRVLGTADVLFLFSSLVFLGTYLRTREAFLHWYACALALTAISLTAFFIQRSVGSPVGWVGRFSQYVGGVYFLVSLVVAARTAERRGTSLDNVLTASLSGAEEKFRALAENAPDVIRRFDRELRLIYVNAAGQRLHGRPAGAVVGKRLEELGPAEESTLWSERILKVFQTGESIQAEEYLTTENGARFYQSQCVPEHGPDGTVANVLVLSRDLTDRKRAEEVLSHANQDWERTFDAVPDLIAILDDQHRITRVNRAMSQHLGRQPNECIGLRCFEAVHGLEAPPEFCPHTRTLLDGQEHTVEVHEDRLGGDFVVSTTPLTGANCNLAGTVHVARDITHRKLAEEALRESEERYRTLFSSMSEGYAVHEVICDAQGQPTDYRFLAVNPGFERLTGLRASEVLGRTVKETVPGIEPLWIERYGRVALTGEAAQFESFSQSLGRWYRVYASRIAPRQFSVIFLDITDQKHSEEALRAANARLEEADRHKDDFLAALSHELRNPLAPIMNSLYVLDHAPPGREAAKRAKEVIGRQVAQLAHLVDDLLDVTRITRQKIRLQRKRLALNELVRRTCEDHSSMFEEAGCALELAAAPGPLFVDGDWSRLTQVVGNLLQNAAKFTERGGRVNVSVSSEADTGRAVVRVADSGIGMAPETLARLFQPFVQADKSLDRSKGGLGLGLALVKGLVELHGGEIRAHSEGLGKGSEFIVQLALAETPGRSLHLEQPAGSVCTRRVLVIEDNVDAASSLRDVLELAGHEVEVAHDGPGGLTKARQFRPEVVLCDIGLPGMNGFEVARAFRADDELKGTFLVALSGYALPQDLEQAAEAGFQRHLAKPMNPDVLDALLADVGRRMSRPGNTTAPGAGT